MSIVDELFDIRSGCTVTNYFDESATRLARCRASIGESGVCLLGVNERSTEGLKWMRRGFSEVPSE